MADKDKPKSKPRKRPTPAIDLEPKGDDRRRLVRLGALSPAEADLE